MAAISAGAARAWPAWQCWCAWGCCCGTSRRCGWCCARWAGWAVGRCTSGRGRSGVESRTLLASDLQGRLIPRQPPSPLSNLNDAPIAANKNDSYLCRHPRPRFSWPVTEQESTPPCPLFPLSPACVASPGNNRARSRPSRFWCWAVR